jgi:hypothetical protein
MRRDQGPMAIENAKRFYLGRVSRGGVMNLIFRKCAALCRRIEAGPAFG